MMIEDARQIAQGFIDRQGDATISGDKEATLDWCDLPCTLESLPRRVIATNNAEMRGICEMFINRLKLKCVTHMVRNCLEASFKDRDASWASYHARYVGHSNLLTDDPYIGHVVLPRKKERR